MLYENTLSKKHCNTQSSVGTTRIVTNQGTVVQSNSNYWTEVIASTTYDSYGMLVNLNSGFTSGTNVTRLVDIGVGPAGSETVIIPKILCGQEGTYTSSSGVWLYFPMFIKAGTRVSARGTYVKRALRIYIQLVQQPLAPDGFVYGTYCEALGYVNDTQGGTAIAAGASGEGSWVSLGTTTKPLFAWQMSVKPIHTDTANAAVVYDVDLAVGNGSQFVDIIQSAHLTTTTAEARAFQVPLFCNHYPVKTGSTLYARAQCSGSPDQLVVMAYGVG